MGPGIPIVEHPDMIKLQTSTQTLKNSLLEPNRILSDTADKTLSLLAIFMVLSAYPSHILYRLLNILIREINLVRAM